MDVHSPEQRSFNMSRIRGKSTRPEMMVRRWLWSNGYRYRLHRKDLPGEPDIVLPRYHTVIFVHGCFWHLHDCRYFKWPKTNKKFWEIKIKGNAKRDQKNYSFLLKGGWNYFIVWECQLKGENPEVFTQLKWYLDNAICISKRQEVN